MPFLVGKKECPQYFEKIQVDFFVFLHPKKMWGTRETPLIICVTLGGWRFVEQDQSQGLEAGLYTATAQNLRSAMPPKFKESVP